MQIKDIEVNDVLKFGEKVEGIIKIHSYDINGLYIYNVDNSILKCSKNIEIADNLGNYNTSTLQGQPIENTKYIYNIITDKGTFNINNVKVFDYRNTLSKYLNKQLYTYNLNNKMNI